MESELWSDIITERHYGNDLIFVDNKGNWRYYDTIYEDEIGELIGNGFNKWCYVADLVQAASNM